MPAILSILAIATGGMRAKLESAVEALQTGTAEVVIAPGAAPGIVAKASGRAMPSALDWWLPMEVATMFSSLLGLAVLAGLELCSGTCPQGDACAIFPRCST